MSADAKKDGIEVNQESYDRAVEKLRPRASFELSCAAKALNFTLLETYGSYGFPTSLGVEGCQERAVYVLVVQTGQWVMNTQDGQPATK